MKLKNLNMSLLNKNTMSIYKINLNKNSRSVNSQERRRIAKRDSKPFTGNIDRQFGTERRIS